MSSQKDPNQIAQAEHDDASNAKRVIIVGGGSFSMPEAAQAPDSLAKALEALTKAVEQASLNANRDVIPEKETVTISVPHIVTESRIERVEVPVVVKEVQIVEVPVVVKEIERIEVPVYNTEYKTVEIPVIIKEIQEKAAPKALFIAIIALNVLQLGLFTYIALK